MLAERWRTLQSLSELSSEIIYLKLYLEITIRKIITIIRKYKNEPAQFISRLTMSRGTLPSSHGTNLECVVHVS